MIRLDDFIAKHRNEMDLNEPEQGHIERFRSRLAPPVSLVRSLTGIAAAVIMGALILFTVQFYRNTGREQETISSLSTEIQETLYYYNSKNIDMLDELNQFKSSDQFSIKHINRDLKGYDEDLKQLMEDLDRFPDDPRIINAIIENQRSKTEMLGYVLKQLSQLNV